MWLGIDFGTCYSSAAFLKDRIPTPVKFGVRMDRNVTSLPSSVYLDEQGKLLVGLAAESRRGRARHDPTRYRREFKRDLGTRNPLPLGDREVLPEQLATEVLRALKSEAEKNQMLADGAPASVVLTVPASYKKQKKELMRGAAAEAGFERVELLPEPVAAAVYYAWRSGSEREGETTLVYDLGGGTFDAALIRKRGEDYESLAASVGHERLGGIDFDRLIGDHLLASCGEGVRQLLKGGGAGEDAEARLNRLRHRLAFADQCREMKEQLSWDTEAAVVFPQEPLNEYALTRDELNGLIGPLIAETCDICRQLVEAAGVKWRAVDRVLLVGGSSRIPYVREAVERELKRPAVRADDPELAVCFGAAVRSQSLAGAAEKAPGRGATAPSSGSSAAPAKAGRGAAARENGRAQNGRAAAAGESATAGAAAVKPRPGGEENEVLQLGPAPAGRRAARGAGHDEEIIDLSASAPAAKGNTQPAHPMASAYQTVVEMAWADGKLGRDEVDKLEALRRRLGLGEDDARAVEIAVLGKSKEATLRRLRSEERKAAEKRAAEKQAAEKRAAEKRAAEKRAAAEKLKKPTERRVVKSDGMPDRRAMLSALGRYKVGQSYYVHPNIPQDLLNNARGHFTSYGYKPAYEILALLDTTWFSTGKRGLIVCREGLFYDISMWCGMGSIDRDQMKSAEFKFEGGDITWGTGHKFPSWNGDSKQLFELLKDLQKLFRAA